MPQSFLSTSTSSYSRREPELGPRLSPARCRRLRPPLWPGPLLRARPADSLAEESVGPCDTADASVDTAIPTAAVSSMVITAAAAAGRCITGSLNLP